jgi:hypothetical protein
MVRIVEPVTQRSPSEHQPVGKRLSNNIRIILQMDDGPEQGGQDDREPDLAARAASAARQKAAKEYFLACCPSALRAMSRRAVRYRGSQGFLGVNELGQRLGQSRSVRRISAPAPGSGDRRAGQFALAKGKLHGLLSGAEP